MRLNVNTDAVVAFTRKLETMHKSALPVAIRTALNSAAFDVKKDTLPYESGKAFVNRQPNFFKANSRVDQASGFNISSMRSTVGMVSSGLKGGNNYSVEDLEQQEHGGKIKKKSFIPLNTARAGSSVKNVTPKNRLSGINKIVDARKAKGTSEKQKFVKSVYFAGVGGFVLSKFNGKEILWKVNSLNKTKNGQFKLTPLYSFEKNRSINVRATHFMERASMSSGKKIETFYIVAAQKQINKLK